MLKNSFSSQFHVLIKGFIKNHFIPHLNFLEKYKFTSLLYYHLLLEYFCTFYYQRRCLNTFSPVSSLFTLQIQYQLRTVTSAKSLKEKLMKIAFQLIVHHSILLDKNNKILSSSIIIFTSNQ